MKTVHICELCGKHYDDEKYAVRCELAHKREEERLKKESAEEKKLLSAISVLIDLYIKKYNKFPQDIELSEDGMEIIVGETATTFEQLMEELYEEDEEDEEYECDEEDDDLGFFFGDDE